jgi:hypothetical protein
MTETMEIIHGIRNITPGAIATTAMLVSVFYHLSLVTHYHTRQSGVFLGMIPFNNAGRPPASTTLPSTKIISS